MSLFDLPLSWQTRKLSEVPVVTSIFQFSSLLIFRGVLLPLSSFLSPPAPDVFRVYIKNAFFSPPPSLLVVEVYEICGNKLYSQKYSSRKFYLLICNSESNSFLLSSLLFIFAVLLRFSNLNLLFVSVVLQFFWKIICHFLTLVLVSLLSFVHPFSVTNFVVF